MREQVKSLTKSQAKDFCIHLWNELTIAGRSIWTDEKLDQATQLNALKWLNEVQHRVWGAYSSDRPDSLMHLLGRIISHCEEAPILGFHVRVALDRSLAELALTKGRAVSDVDQLAGAGLNNSFKPSPHQGGA